MKLFKSKERGVEYIEIYNFKLEKEIQVFVEKNSDTFFKFDFVRSMSPIGEFRLN